jgi:hypothetical protein
LPTETPNEIEMLSTIVTALRAPAGPEHAKLFHMGENAARRIADLVEIGAAPTGHELPGMIRGALKLHDSVRLILPIDYAIQIADLIEIGKIRTDAGIAKASDFRLN